MGDVQLGGAFSRVRVLGQNLRESIELPALQVKLIFGPTGTVTKNGSRVGLLNRLHSFYLKHMSNLWMVFVEKSCNPVINTYRLAHDGGVSHA